MSKLYSIIYKLLYCIADYCNSKADKYYNKHENILEKQYSKLVTDFYENGIGYYGKE